MSETPPFIDEILPKGQTVTDLLPATENKSKITQAIDDIIIGTKEDVLPKGQTVVGVIDNSIEN